MVHWEGYPTEEDTWEPVENVKNAQELIMKFHADYPDKPAPPAVTVRYMHREDELKALEENPRLFHYIYGTSGEGFKKPNRPASIDVTVPLNPQQAENLLHQPLDPLPQLPSEMRRVWIYETEPVNAITMTIQLDSEHTPLRMYQIMTPLDTRT